MPEVSSRKKPLSTVSSETLYYGTAPSDAPPSIHTLVIANAAIRGQGLYTIQDTVRTGGYYALSFISGVACINSLSVS